eukprot:2259227-Pyramimonas_sp.AAC.1
MKLREARTQILQVWQWLGATPARRSSDYLNFAASAQHGNVLIRLQWSVAELSPPADRIPLATAAPLRQQAQLRRQLRTRHR